jgi:hypothetical protein
MIFPQWDMITVILAVFLMGWIVNEGKSNYFKGSILIFTYLVVVVGFWFSGYGDAEVSSFLFFSFSLLGVFSMIVWVDFTDGAFFRRWASIALILSPLARRSSPSARSVNLLVVALGECDRKRSCKGNW